MIHAKHKSISSSLVVPLQKKKQTLPMRQIHRKYPKSVGKLIVGKFTDGFLSLSVIIDGFPTDF